MVVKRRKKKNSNLGVAAGIGGFVLFMGGLVFASTIGEVDEAGARNALLKQGYYDIQIDGRAYLTCGVDYRQHTKFRARNPLGQWKTGAVCSGGNEFNTIIKLDD